MYTLHSCQCPENFVRLCRSVNSGLCANSSRGHTSGVQEGRRAHSDCTGAESSRWSWPVSRPPVGDVAAKQVDCLPFSPLSIRKRAAVVPVSLARPTNIQTAIFYNARSSVLLAILCKAFSSSLFVERIVQDLFSRCD